MADALLCHRLQTEHQPVRLLGMGVSGLNDTRLVQGMLFDEEERQEQSRLDAVVDEIRDRFGKGSLRRGSSLKPRKKPESG